MEQTHPDIFGTAMLDYLAGKTDGKITTCSSLDEEDEIPVPYLFRNYGQMPKLEQKALNQCHGHILDIGCGAGSHSLYLQEQGHEVTALDSSAGAIESCRQRGIERTEHRKVLEYEKNTFDTLLLLMNGIGIVGTLEKLPVYLDHFRKLLRPHGQILLDSSNIIYMFEQDDDGGYWIPGSPAYYGEVEFQMTYNDESGPWFPWLYVDFDTLAEACQKVDLHCELVSEGEHYDYLARLTEKPY
ncbi:class I SAM-dependent methyltransferase [Flagellimonas sp. DF-77]|uniref:class I SAM-dependent methyltransferase n=1 Tax=Flagellimonas algarum TaxID=3230298 RepID=UPI00339AED00